MNYNLLLTSMRRFFFFRPFFNSFDPFMPRIHGPQLRIRMRANPLSQPAERSQNPHDVFDQFFEENKPQHENEKAFFKKHYPEKIEEPFDPYKVLELNKDATLDQVKDAYRKLAIKYHPKNNSAPDAENKFAEVAKAYQEIVEAKERRDLGEFGFNSFFEDIEKEVDAVFGPPK